MTTRGRLAMQHSELEDCNKLKRILGDAMKAYVTVAEDLQDGGDKFSSEVDKLEQQVMDLARMERDLVLIGKAVEKAGEVEREYSTGQQQEEEEEGEQEGPPELVEVFEDTLSSLRNEDDYNPKTHPQWREFVERVREGEEEEGGRLATQEEGEDADIVMAQVQRSLKCPLTQQYMEDPVTSSLCSHSYSRTAIVQHIRNSHTHRQAKCPVCNMAISEADLKSDEQLRRQIRRAVRNRGRDKHPTDVVSL